MIALVARPGQADSTRLVDVADSGGDQPGAVRVRTLEVGVCGTDRSIAAGRFGSPPPGSTELVLGHEVVGVVERGASGLEVGTYVAATVRRGCGQCSNCAADEYDACTSGRFRERGIVGLHGFASEWFTEQPEHLVRIPSSIGRLGVLAEPASISARGLRHARYVGHRQGWEPRRVVVLGVGAVGMLTVYMLRLAGLETWAMARSHSTSEKARLVTACGASYVSTADTSLRQLADRLDGVDLILEAAGDAELAAEAIAALGPNGVLCLRGIAASRTSVTIRSDLLMGDVVLNNKSIIGSTNAAREDWDAGVSALEQIATRWPDALPQVIGLTVDPERFHDALHYQGVKSTIRFS